MSKQKLTHDRLRSLLDYDPETGLFTRRFSQGAAKAGRPCGCIGSSGYLRTMIEGQSYLNHRLAWFYMTGDWPPFEVDHINFDKTDNRFANLRCATRAQNASYKKPMETRLGLPRGVIRSKDKFAARIYAHGQFRHLGRHPTIESAQAAYEAAARELYGDFAPVSRSARS